MTNIDTELAKIPWATLGRREAFRDLSMKLKEQEQRFFLLKNPPLFSLIVPVEKSCDLKFFSLAVAALRRQAYPRFEVVFIGGKGTETHESRIKTEPFPKFRWISKADAATAVVLKNEGLRSAKGDWIGFLEAGDILSPAALYQLAVEIEAGRGADVLYTNEVELDPSGTKISRCLNKCDYSWFTLIHFNYIRRFWVMRSERVRELGLLDNEAGVHAEHEFLLRADRGGAGFSLAPFYFYYTRHPKVVAADEGLKKIVEKHLAEKEFPAHLTFHESAIHRKLKVIPKVSEPQNHPVTAIVCFRNKAEWTVECVKSLAAAPRRVPLEVILVNNQSSPEQERLVREATQAMGIECRWVDYDYPFNYGNMHNVALSQSRGKYLFVLNNDVAWSAEHSLDELVAWAQMDWAGTVGISLRYPYGKVQHAGLRAMYGGEARLARVGNAQDEDIFTDESREVFGNTFAACLMKRETFESVGGLNELEYPNGLGDVAFSFECRKRNLKNLHLGHVRAMHRESGSRGIAYEYWEERSLERRYPEMLERMLRTDFGYKRGPGADLPLRQVFWSLFHRTVITYFPWMFSLRRQWMWVKRRLQPVH